MKLKRLKKTVPEILPDLDSSVASLNAVFDEVGGELIERSEHLNALKLALISGHHLMLNGPPGVAKSMLADHVFNRVTGAVVYSHQFRKTTQPDQVFGPLNSEKYRREAVWEHNITGMLPTAHFAFLDEVYRAADSVLPSMLGILNERTFFNGLSKIKCPLITAIGTTNFVTQSSELEAFHDRWLIQLDVKPLAARESRLAAMKGFLASLRRSSSSAPASKSTVSLDEIRALRIGASALKANETTLMLYEELVSRLRLELKDVYISDRRICCGLQLAQAASILEDADASEISSEALSSVGLALTAGLPNQTDVLGKFTDSLVAVVGDFARLKVENKNFTLIEQATKEWLANFDRVKSEKAPFKRCRKLHSTLQSVVTTLTSLGADEAPSSGNNVRILEQSVSLLSSAVESLNEKLNGGKLKTVDNNMEEVEVPVSHF